ADLVDGVEDLVQQLDELAAGYQLGPVGAGLQAAAGQPDQQRGPEERRGPADVRHRTVPLALEAVEVVRRPQVADEHAARCDEGAQPGQHGTHVAEVVDGVQAGDHVGGTEVEVGPEVTRYQAQVRVPDPLRGQPQALRGDVHGGDLVGRGQFGGQPGELPGATGDLQYPRRVPGVLPQEPCDGVL